MSDEPKFGQFALARHHSYDRGHCVQILDGEFEGMIYPISLEHEVHGIWGKEFIVRVNSVPIRTGGQMTNTNFVTSVIPDDFQESYGPETVVLGLWEPYMTGGYSVPIVGRVAEFFNPGYISTSIHFKDMRSEDICNT
jgi:hypothetical protein